MKNKTGGHTLPNIKDYFIAIVIKILIVIPISES